MPKDNLEEYLKTRKTRIANLSLLSTPTPFCFHAAGEYPHYMKKVENLGAISLELDPSYQLLLDEHFEKKQKFRYTVIPGFAYAINYGINNQIPPYASDKFQQEYYFKIQKTNEILENAIKTGDMDNSQMIDMVVEWKEAQEKLGKERVEGTVKNLTELSKKIKGNIVHLCSDNQAEKILKII